MNTQPELIADLTLACGESPLWHPAEQRLYWVDSGSDHIYSWQQDTGEQSSVATGVPIAALALHEDGGLVLAGSQGLFHWHENQPIHSLSIQTEGKSVTGINDLIVDKQGRLFGGQEVYQENQPYDPGYLYRINTDGTAQIIDEGFHIANGMGFSPDNTTFYVIDSIPRLVYAYDYQSSTGHIANRRVLIRLPKDAGLPDGMTVDQQGYLWVARWFGGGLSRFDPDGRLEREITLPVAQPTSVNFGGAGWDELYITTAATHWETSLAPAQHDYTTARGGGVYRLRGAGSGVAENQSRLLIT